jgi:hypothetical protein
VGAYIFLEGTLPPLLQQMWDLLTVVVHHYFRGSIDYSAASAAAAHAALLSYARLMEEKKFPDDKMFTFNLHMLVCRYGMRRLQAGGIGV